MSRAGASVSGSPRAWRSATRSHRPSVGPPIQASTMRAILPHEPHRMMLRPTRTTRHFGSAQEGSATMSGVKGVRQNG